MRNRPIHAKNSTLFHCGWKKILTDFFWNFWKKFFCLHFSNRNSYCFVCLKLKLHPPFERHFNCLFSGCPGFNFTQTQKWEFLVEKRKQNTMTLWRCDAMTLWHYDAMTLWRCDAMTLWDYDAITLWHYDAVTLWHYETMTLLRYDTITLWRYDAIWQNFH